MASTFTWLDYSELQRRKMLDVIQLFQEKDTRDELGIGSIRDAYADLLFPGTSTIQTRACYFLFVPWIYQRLAARGTPGSKIAVCGRRDEVALIASLAARGERGGVIGIDKRGQLQRLASNIYWAGLARWRFHKGHCR